MERITYTAAQKKLFDASWKGRGKGLGTVRAIKMAKPECKVCQVNDTQLVGWWKNCQEEGHDPYFSMQPKVVRVPVYTTDDDGDMVLDEEQTKLKSRTKFVRVANVIEVLMTPASNAGIGPMKKHDRYGFAYLQEVGIAPMCEASGCGKSFPEIRTEYGDYCSIQHARLVKADVLGIKLIAYTDDSPQAVTAQRSQLSEISV